MIKSILITGASGFLGRALAIHFLQQQYEVHLLVRNPAAIAALSRHYSNAHVHHYNNSYLSLTSLNEIKPLSLCIHTAAVAAYETTPNNLDTMIDANLRFGMHLLEKLCEIRCSRLVNTGTYWQHYRGREYNPVCLYAATKEAFNAVIEYYVQAHGLQAITLKLFEVYGANDPRKKIFPLLMKALQGNETLLMSPGEQLLNMTFIDDVITAYEQAACILMHIQQPMNCHYFVRSEQEYTLKEIVNLFFQIAGKSIDIQWGGRSYYERQIMQPYAGQVVPGWQAKINLQEGIQRVLQAETVI